MKGDSLMQHREVREKTNVPTSQPHQQEGTRHTDFSRPEVSQRGQNEEELKRLENIRAAQRLFEPGAARPSQSTGARPERFNPSAPEALSPEEIEAQKEKFMEQLKLLHGRPAEGLDTAGELLDAFEQERGNPPPT
jgi:hypothetical protein